MVVLTASTANALARTASVTGDWNDIATWGGSSVPGSADSVTINSGVTVTVPSGYAAQCITIAFTTGNVGLASITLTDGTSSLTASGAVTIQRGGGYVNQIDVGAGTFSATSVALQATTGGTMLSQILISTGTVTISGNITSLGVDSRIVFSDAGTLNAGGTFLSGTAGTFTASTGTVNYTAAAQTVGAYAYNNLTLSGSGAKTTTGVTVNGILSMQGTATASVVPTYGVSATLRYNTATSRTAGVEWLTPFAAAGGVVIDNTGTITMNAIKVFNASIPLTINSGATLASGNFQLTFGGDFINNGGTFTGGSAPIIIANTMVAQSIDGFTTTGAVSMTKTAGVATFTGNVNGGTFTINGTGGTLNLGIGLTHTFTGTWTRTAGSLNASSSTLKIGGSISGTGGTFTAGTSSVVLQSATAATISGSNIFYNFSCTTPSKSILVTQGTTQTIGGLFQINGGSTGTRVSLASTGGAGTTWNLVLNGSYDCANVAVQGSNASSGTVSLPINPAGFLDNGNNTNWALTARTATVSGDWNNTATWGGAAIPGAADSVTINSGVTVTIPSGYAAQCTTINFTTGIAGLASITLTDNTSSLTASGAVTIQSQAAGGNVNQINVGAGTFSAVSVALQGAATGSRFTQILISTGTVTISGNITSLGADSRITFSDAGTLNAGGTFLSGTAGTFTPSTGTVNYTAAAQTVGRYTYNNLTLSGSGLKTTTTVTINGVLLIQGTATASAAPTYGANATLRYDTATSRTAGVEWRTPFTGTGGVIIGNIGAITMNGAKVFNLNIPLTINSGATLATANFQLTFGGNFINNGGTFTAGSSAIVITNTMAAQSIAGFTTTAATVSMTKTAGIATFTGNANGGGLTINGTGGTLNLGTGLTHTFTGTWTRTAGTVDGGSSTLKIGLSVSGTGGTFTASTGTVDWNRVGAQTLAGVTYNNLTLSGTSAKTTTGVTVNGVLSMEGTATLFAAAPTYGPAATLRYNTATPRTAGTEWINPFVAAGGVIIDNTGTITMNSVEVFNASVPLTINSGATLATGNFQLTFGGNFVNNGGTFTGGSSPIVIANTMVAQSIAGFTTTGLVSMTKTVGTATFTGNVSGSGLTINSIGGTLDLGTGLTHTFTGAWTRTAGTLNGGSSTLKIGGSISSTGGTFACGTGTVELNGSALQAVTIGGSDFNRLTVTNASVAGVSFADSFTTAYFTNTTANSLMTFAASRTYNITATGGINFQGASGQLVKLRSSTPGSVWLINPSGGSWTANYLDVRDSVNIVEQTIFPTNSTDSGNNTNWFSAGQDSNGDEIPDWWEYSYYGSLTGLNAGTDSDDDGVINFFEYIIGSNPRESASPTVVYADDNGGYDGTGTSSNPYKYLDTALDNISDGQMLRLAEGTYQTSNYGLSKNILIKGASARKTIIKGPVPAGGSSDKGQMLAVDSKRFAISDMTIRLYQDDQPIISYNPEAQICAFNNLIIKDNSIKTKALIAPVDSNTEIKFYLTNSLVNANRGALMLDIRGNPAKMFQNTIFKNETEMACITSGTGNVEITNNILRNSQSEIKETGSGSVKVTYCNIEGEYIGNPGNYDEDEKFLDPSIGCYRLHPGTRAEDSGTETFAVWDGEWVTRPQGARFDVGAFEIPAVDYDNDGISNGEELLTYKTDEYHPDTDLDGLYDGEEVTYGTKPLSSDTDGDLVKDGDEPPIGMNPAVFDGQILIGIYAESFESQLQYPVAPQSVGGMGPWSGTIWGGNTKCYGDIQVQYVGPPPAAYEGNKIINLKGQIFPRSCNISLIESNGLTEWWISAAFIFPWKRLPTDYNEACCIGGAFFRLNENGNFCVYDGSIENWRVSSTVIPDGTWANIFVERNADATCNLWMPVVSTLVPVFENIPIAGPDLTNFIRISLSNASEYDVKVDMMVGYRYSPF